MYWRSVSRERWPICRTMSNSRVPGLGEMFHLCGRQLRGLEGAGKADQQQGPVAEADQAAGKRIDHGTQTAREQSLLANSVRSRGRAGCP
jgi:hypothetical protein